MEVLRARRLHKTFHPTKGMHGQLHAVSDVSFSLHSGRVLGIVGQSGSGKSTLARLLMGLDMPTHGEVDLWDGQRLVAGSSLSQRARASKIQMIFQDPLASLNPRYSALEAVMVPLLYAKRMSKSAARDQACAWLDKVGLNPAQHTRFGHQLSGGQRQRIAIARALALAPNVVVCDEMVSALDASVQAQILNLLMALQNTQQTAYVFISHDLSVVRHMADDVLVMYLGEGVEYGRAQDVLDNPQHPYTQALVEAVPTEKFHKHFLTACMPQGRRHVMKYPIV